MLSCLFSVSSHRFRVCQLLQCHNFSSSSPSPYTHSPHCVRQFFFTCLLAWHGGKIKFLSVLCCRESFLCMPQKRRKMASLIGNSWRKKFKAHTYRKFNTLIWAQRGNWWDEKCFERLSWYLTLIQFNQEMNMNKNKLLSCWRFES